MGLKKTLIGVLIVAVLIALGIIGGAVITWMFRSDPQKAMAVHGKMPIRVATAKIETVNDVIGASGQTQETERVTLTALISQPVTSVKIILGDLVKKGQVLYEFKQTLLQAVLQEARESLQKTRTDLDYAKTNYKRMQNLFSENLVAKIDLEKADADIKKAQWEEASALQQVEKATQDLRNTVLHSTVAGVVLERPVNLGETPKLNDPVVTLGLIDDIFMMAHVPEEKIAYVRLKQKAEMVFDSFLNETFTGEITKIDPNTDPKTKTFVAYVRIHNKDLRLRPGLTGFARVANVKQGLAVPSVSVLNPVGESATIFVADANSVVHIRKVKIGVSGGGLTQITEGLKEGEKVVTAGLEFLKDGDRAGLMEDVK